jgi:hypothetical protein
MNLIRSIIRGWKRIEYYSAAQHRTRWGRAFDVAFVACLLLAIPAMLVAESMVRRPFTEFWIAGQVAQKPESEYIAVIDRDEPEDQREPWQLPGTPIGEFTITVVEERAGWPVVSRLDGAPPRIDYNVFIEPGTRENARFDDPVDQPVLRAIEEEMRRVGHAEVMERWRERDALHDERYWLGTIYGSGIWWLMLTVASAIAIGSARLAWGFAADHRLTREQRLLAQGRCHVCGYDLKGLEFAERCPECGSLVK